ncbi:MAG: hypothetical protein OXN17_14490 [Candidatus Poribacteria bacterium]|nr:hypothetical protein [Candidatus Poribacteria bacterium]
MTNPNSKYPATAHINLPAADFGGWSAAQILPRGAPPNCIFADIRSRVSLEKPPSTRAAAGFRAPSTTNTISAIRILIAVVLSRGFVNVHDTIPAAAAIFRLLIRVNP